MWSKESPRSHQIFQNPLFPYLPSLQRKWAPGILVNPIVYLKMMITKLFWTPDTFYLFHLSHPLEYRVHYDLTYMSCWHMMFSIYSNVYWPFGSTLLPIIVCLFSHDWKSSLYILDISFLWNTPTAIHIGFLSPFNFHIILESAHQFFF